MVDLSPWAWAGFLGVVALLLGIDLGFFHKRPHDIKLREASAWAFVWISVGVAFSAVVWWLYSTAGSADEAHEAAQLYLTGFILEKSLSVDNLFVFIVILGYFEIETRYQHEVLFYGILGALAFRAVFIFAGVAALHTFEWTIYVLAAVLIYTALKMGTAGATTLDPGASRVYRFLEKRLPITPASHAGRFFIRGTDGRRMATSLFLALIMIEASDVLFAVDSVPAVLGVTSDPFIVYTSNIFAVLGLRSLFFVVAAGLKTMHYLKPALVLLLLFIGAKMLLAGPWWHVVDIPVTWSLAAVSAILGTAILASAAFARRHPEQAAAETERATGVAKTFKEKVAPAAEPEAGRAPGAAGKLEEE